MVIYQRAFARVGGMQLSPAIRSHLCSTEIWHGASYTLDTASLAPSSNTGNQLNIRIAFKYTCMENKFIKLLQDGKQSAEVIREQELSPWMGQEARTENGGNKTTEDF